MTLPAVVVVTLFLYPVLYPILFLISILVDFSFLFIIIIRLWHVRNRSKQENET